MGWQPLMLVLAAAVLGGCGGSDAAPGDPSRYQTREEDPVRLYRQVTMPNGEVVSKPVLPAALTAEPSPSCESTYVNGSDGSRLVIAPPMPGLRAIAVTEHTTRIEWWFEELPDDCGDVQLYLLVDALTADNASPWIERGVEVDGLSGSMEVTYPDFLPAPQIASATAYFPTNGLRGRTATVLIERSPDTPPDPPKPLPPITAPAGEPATCSSKPRVVRDPAGDVMTYGPGSPPTRVKTMTRTLAGLDITQARVQIDGRTICASFTFAQQPSDVDFQVSLYVSDPGRDCCISLRYRRTAGRVEVGRHYVDANGVYQLDPIEDGGASLSGRTLVMTGTIPSTEDPPTANVIWSSTATYYPADAPDFGDWLPRHEPIDQPAIRHRDGAVVRT